MITRCQRDNLSRLSRNQSTVLISRVAFESETPISHGSYSEAKVELGDLHNDNADIPGWRHIRLAWYSPRLVSILHFMQNILTSRGALLDLAPFLQ